MHKFSYYRTHAESETPQKHGKTDSILLVSTVLRSILIMAYKNRRSNAHSLTFSCTDL